MDAQPLLKAVIVNSRPRAGLTWNLPGWETIAPSAFATTECDVMPRAPDGLLPLPEPDASMEVDSDGEGFYHGSGLHGGGMPRDLPHEPFFLHERPRDLIGRRSLRDNGKTGKKRGPSFSWLQAPQRPHRSPVTKRQVKTEKKREPNTDGVKRQTSEHVAGHVVLAEGIGGGPGVGHRDKQWRCTVPLAPGADHARACALAGTRPG